MIDKIKAFFLHRTTLTLVGIAVGILAWRFPVFAEAGSTTQIGAAAHKSAPHFSGSHHSSTAALSVSGTGVKVEIRAAADGAQYLGGAITSTGTTSVIYLPEGQRLALNISGTGVVVAVQSVLMPYIQVNNTGTGANVYEY